MKSKESKKNAETSLDREARELKKRREDQLNRPLYPDGPSYKQLFRSVVKKIEDERLESTKSVGTNTRKSMEDMDES